MTRFRFGCADAIAAAAGLRQYAWADPALSSEKSYNRHDFMVKL